MKHHASIPRIARVAALLAVSIGLLLAPAAAFAGPWVKTPGEAYLKLGGGLFGSEKVFSLEGDLIEPEYKYSHAAVRTYGEVGVFPRVALQFSVPFLASTNELNERIRYNRWGPGDLDLAVQVSLLEGSGACAASIAPGARIPLYEGTVGAGGGVNVIEQGSTGVQRYTPALGDGSVDLTAIGAFGCSLHPLPGWVTAAAGPRIRLDGFGNSIDYAVDAGFFVWPERLALTARVGGVQRLSDGNERPTKSYVNVGGGLILNLLEGFALEGGASYIPTGAFVAQGWNLTAGISYTGELFGNPYD